MNVVGNLKKRVGEFVLKKQAKHNKHKVKTCNLKEAKKIGVLFNATHVISFEVVKNFIKQISTPANEIMALGYVDSKQMIDHYLYRKGYEFYTRTHLNWYNKPESKAVTEFINKDFDILIDLNLEETYPTKYILALSKACFKAGKYTENHKILDFMIDIESEKEAIKQLQTEINKEQNAIRGHSTSYDNIADKKTDVELQLNFLINQLIHYLSKIKK